MDASAGPPLKCRGSIVLPPSARGFDMSRFRYRHVALLITYLGGAYRGFAAQGIPSSCADGDPSTRRGTAASSSTSAPAAAADTASSSSSSAAPPPRAGVKRSRPSSSSSGGDADAAAASPPASTAPPGAASSATPTAPADFDTVESVLYGALTQACLIESRAGCGYTRCGRTDKGVSAAGQVVALRVRSRARRTTSTDAVTPAPGVWYRCDGVSNDGEDFPPPSDELDYCHLLNVLLPTDIRVIGWADVDDTFSARFTATSRTYRYYFVRRPDLDIVRLATAARGLVGVHDFAHMCSFDVASASHTQRHILYAQVRVAGDAAAAAASFPTSTSPPPLPLTDAQLATIPVNTLMYIEISGRAFLWHQIRAIMGILFHIARGFEPVSLVASLLDTASVPRKPSYALASEAPLVLFHCGYGETGETGGSMPEGISLAAEDEGVACAVAAESGAVPRMTAPSDRWSLSDAGLYARMNMSVQALRGITATMEAAWQDHVIAAGMIRDMMDRVYASNVTKAAVDAELARMAGSKRARWGDDAATHVTWREAAEILSLAPTPPDDPEATPARGIPRAALALSEHTYPVRGRTQTYIPMLQRISAPSHVERWTALSDESRAEIARIHPHNAARLDKKAEKVRALHHVREAAQTETAAVAAPDVVAVAALVQAPAPAAEPADASKA